MGFWGAVGTAAGIGLDYFGQKEAAADAKSAAAKANALQIHLAREQMAKQEEFAKMGIQWRVRDAVAAGLHPLAALGTNAASYSPVAATIFPETDSSAGSFARTLGQNLQRSHRATMTEHERVENRLRLENMHLQNDLLRAQIADRVNDPGNPPMPSAGTDNFISGQGNSGVMLVKPSERTASAPGRPAQEAGWRPDVSYSRTDTGLVPVIPQGLSESMEDDMVGKILWRIRNQVFQNFGGGGRPPKSMLPRGAVDWQWHHGKQEFQPAYPQRAPLKGRDFNRYRGR